MTVSEDKSLSILFARLDDLHRSADRGVLGSTSFLSPRDLHFADVHLREAGLSSRALSWGGYADAERKKIYILPEFMEGAEYGDFAEYGFENDISAVEVTGSGYRKLSHRDFLGSVLGLGLERDVLGDVIVREGEKPSAVIICDSAVSEFICENLLKVGSDTVKARVIDACDIQIPERKFLSIRDTVASARLDGVIASLISVSRERAKEIVLDGAVEVNYEACERPDRVITSPCVISIRGYGKFRINSLEDRTKKGRIRLDADRYV